MKCILPERGEIDEDAKVIAGWLDISRVYALVYKHLATFVPLGIVIDPNGYALYVKNPSNNSALKIHDSNELHSAYNAWVRRRDRPDKSFWVVVMPSDTAYDTDFDIRFAWILSPGQSQIDLTTLTR